MSSEAYENPSAAAIAALLKQARRIAVVGASSNPERPSYRVARHLAEHGYEVFPVNPAESEILGRKCYKSLSEIEKEVDIVDIFRRSDQTDAVIDEALKIGSKAIWLQEGVINDSGAIRARTAGATVIQNRCIKKELMRL